MISRSCFLALVIIVLTGCAAQGMGASLPTPSGITITQPDSDLPPEVAAFSGTWEGIWDGVLLSRLIVERIDWTSARVVYVWADDPGGYFKAGWGRHAANVLPGGKIQWGRDLRFTFTMSKDQMSIAGEREQGGRINTVTMKKVAQ